MSKAALATLTVAFVAAVSAAAPRITAQGPPVERPIAQPRPAQAPEPQPQPRNGPPPVRPTPPPSDPGQGVNVKVDIAITDQAAAGESSTKTISFLAADRSAGSIRSTANTENARVNVDATPQILPNGNIRIQLGLEYNPRQARAAAQASKSPSGEMVMIPPMEGGSSLNQRVTVVLEPGKPLILSQAADPLSDRKISVEIRASVQK